MEKRILDLLASLVSVAPSNVLDRARSEVSYGEYGIAIENLCDNLFELNARLSSDQLEEFARLAAEMGLREDRWAFIRTLVDSPTDPPMPSA
jgi:hypothetical protein